MREPPAAAVMCSRESDAEAGSDAFRLRQCTENVTRGFRLASDQYATDRFDWWAHQDSNLEPKDYESSALTIEL